MRIAIVTNSFSEVGGAETATQDIVRALTARDHKVTIFLRESETVPRRLTDEFSIKRFPDEVFRVDFAGIWYARRHKRSACRRLKEFDVVQFCMLQSAMALFPFFWRKNWIVTCRGADIQNPRRTAYRKLVAASRFGIAYKGYRTRAWNEAFLRIFMLWGRRRGQFVSISSDMVDELVRLGVPKNRTAKILNGINVERMRRIQDTVSFSGLCNDLTYVLAVGRNDSRKGFFFLLEAAEQLKAAGRRDIRFIVKGRGFERFLSFAKSMDVAEYFSIVDLNHNVDFDWFVGIDDDLRLPDYDVVALYKLADIVVIPSIIEALSTVGLEAEVSDRPLLVSDTFGCREYIRRGTAVGFRTGDSVDLIDKLDSLLTDAELRASLSDARRRHRADSTLERSIDAYVRVIERAVGTAVRPQT